MSNAVLYFNPEAYDTSARALMGRHAAGESFLKGYLQHAKVDKYVFWNIANQQPAKMMALCEALAPIRHPVSWLARENRRAIGDVGVLNAPTPHLAREAWSRRAFGSQTYAVCGITHTTATARIMDAIGNMLVAPVEPWDALICTSRAVRASVEVQLEAVEDELRGRLGATRITRPQLATIPLAINVEDFVRPAKEREKWRRELAIDDDAVVVLYVGRFNAHAKMNPGPMAQALEKAAKSTGKKIAWVMAGWHGDEKGEAEFHEATRKLCPSIDYHILDGRRPEVRFSVWALGDIFISLSDNVQETFGLTPLEAMAAGMPCVVSDWDGYRDTVRNGVDGFRVATYAPAPGAGRDLSFRHAEEWLSYGAYVGAAAQFISVDVEAAAVALSELIKSPELRKKMGQAAQERARAHFDWARVIPQYQALWKEQNERRQAAVRVAPTPRTQRENPWRLDPFRLFAAYPTEWLTDTSIVSLAGGMTWSAAKELLEGPLARTPAFALPTWAEAEAVVAHLSRVRQVAVSELLSDVAPVRRPFVKRGLLWLAKHNIVQIYGKSDVIPD